VRVVSATNRDLEREVNKARFREDLYFRLAVIQVHVPGLRERQDDLPILIRHFLSQLGCPDEERLFPPNVLAEMAKHDWPGNVRELRNYVERTVVLQMASPTSRKSTTSSPSLGGAQNVDIRIPFKLAKDSAVDTFEARVPGGAARVVRRQHEQGGAHRRHGSHVPAPPRPEARAAWRWRSGGRWKRRVRARTVSPRAALFAADELQNEASVLGAHLARRDEDDQVDRGHAAASIGVQSLPIRGNRVPSATVTASAATTRALVASGTNAPAAAATIATAAIQTDPIVIAVVHARADSCGPPNPAAGTKTNDVTTRMTSTKSVSIAARQCRPRLTRTVEASPSIAKRPLADREHPERRLAPLRHDGRVREREQRAGHRRDHRHHESRHQRANPRPARDVGAYRVGVALRMRARHEREEDLRDAEEELVGRNAKSLQAL